MNEIQLRPCPFCNGPAVFQDFNYCASDGVRISCTKCHASSMPLFAGYDMISREMISVDTVKAQSAERWNQRATA